MTKTPIFIARKVYGKIRFYPHPDSTIAKSLLQFAQIGESKRTTLNERHIKLLKAMGWDVQCQTESLTECPNGESNATLMAVAPELLSMLNEACSTIEYVDSFESPDDGTPTIDFDLVKRIKTLIHKAEGKS